jgi:hypothetical protein
MSGLAISLFGELDALRKVTAALQGDAAKPWRAPAFPGLERACGLIEHLAAPKTPPDLGARANQWRAYVAGTASAPSARVLRVLCWEPAIAVTPAFLRELPRQAVLNQRALVGLVRSCLCRWAEGLEGGAARFASQRLAGSQSHPTLDKWRKSPWGPILERDAPCLLGRFLARGEFSPAELCERYRLPPPAESDYLQAAVSAAADQCRAEPERRGSYLIGQLLRWEALPLDLLKGEFTKTVLHDPTSLVMRDPLLDLARQHPQLGDPRLPANVAHWMGYEKAKGKVIAWLSSLDIRFFFDHVFPRGRDKHGRREFWLRYSGRVRQSRCLLSDLDRARLRVSPAAQEAIAATGRIEGATSAFLLDLGDLLVVEFANVGNACYLYEPREAARVIPDFWTTRPFWQSRLKNAGRAAKRLLHVQAWQGEAAQFLARYGIRPN